MNDLATPSRRGGGRDAKRAARLGSTNAGVPFISRGIPYAELLDEEGLALIENNAERILSEIGCEFRDDPEALEIWKAAGAEVTGELVRMPRGMCRQLIQDHAPKEFVHQARNPARSTTIGGKRTVFAPTAGPPFVRCLDKGRRYGTIEDFNNFAKLTHADRKSVV